MSSFHNNALVGASGLGGYQIERSLRFNSADSAYLGRTPGSNSTSQTIFTVSAWVKRCVLASGTTGGSGRQTIFYTGLSSGSGNLFGLEWVSDSIGCIFEGTGTYWPQTTAKFRDASAWYHIVIAVDTTQATAANRCRFYVNGVEQTSLTGTQPPQNHAVTNGTTSVHQIGGGNVPYSNQYITELYYINNQQLTPSSFGETDTVTGVWKPKAYTGTYTGTNSCYLNFKDNSGITATTLGKDYSGNGNNYTPSGLSVTVGAGNDSMIDTPTPYADGGNGRANYPTWNPLTNGNVSVSNGNLDCTYASAAWQNIRSTMAMPASGKWYAEITQNSAATYWSVGICNSNFPNSYYGGQDANSWAWQNGNKFNNGAVVGYGSAGVSGDVFMVAINRATNSIWLGKNGTWFSGDPAAGTTPMYSNLDASGDLFFMAAMYAGAAHIANFGQRSFSYTPPSGFLALNTQNLPEPSIKKPSSYMDVVTYTGTGATQTISSFNFSPNFAWIKSRSTANSHRLFDSVRGATNTLNSNSTSAEVSETDSLTAFNSNGISLGADTVGGGVNVSTRSYVAWCWDESATPGFDIVTYTGDGVAGRTVSHSLGVAPSLIIAKCRSSASTNWPVFGSLLGANKYMLLNSTAASATGAPGYDNGTLATSSVFSIGNQSDINGNGATYVAYLFSEVAGFSKFGSYTGNGSSDGPFVYCGFKPRWLMIKQSSSTESWLIFDTARETYNPTDDVLWANLSNAESANYTPQDFTSNGFKIRTSSTSTNASGGTYIFAAFAESPFKYSLAR